MTEDEMVAAVRRLPQALAARERGPILEILDGLLGARADLGDRWGGFAQLLLRMGEIDRAMAAFDLWIADSAGGIPARFAKAAALAEAGRVVQSLETLGGIPASSIPTAQRAHFLGVGHSQLGDFEAARLNLEAAVAAQPLSGASWHSLIAISDLRVDTELGERLLAQAPALSQTAPANEAPYLHACAAVHDARGEHDLAFDAVSRANRLLRSIRTYDGIRDAEQAERVIAASPPRIRSTGMPDNSPILVLGLPRSGTTLVEDIIARHPAVSGGAEANVFRNVAEVIGGLVAEDVAGSGEMARDLYRHLLEQRVGAGGRPVDKSLGNSRFLGAILALLPAAPVAWIRRDPLDVAWSNLRTYFPQGMAWALDQVTLAQHMRLEDRLFDHWRQCLGGHMLVVDYAELVHRPDEIGARILAHCGLDAREQPRAPCQRVVASASFAQVRAPISPRAVGAAAPYRRHLRPFINAYRKLGGSIPD